MMGGPARFDGPLFLQMVELFNGLVCMLGPMDILLVASLGRLACDLRAGLVLAFRLDFSPPTSDESDPL